MGVFAAFRQAADFYKFYARFEALISGVLLILVSIIIVYSTVILAETLFSDLVSGANFSDATAFKDTFGLVLIVLILIEFNHSIVLAMRQRIGVLQARVIVMITVIVIARKLILLDYSTATWQTLLALGGLALVLGLLYWLLSDIDHRRRAAGLPDE